MSEWALKMDGSSVGGMSLESLTAGTLDSGRGATAAAFRDRACDIVDLAQIPEAAWADLAERAIEPNAFFHPAWARAVDRHATGKTGARALLAWDGPGRTRLLGMIPVVSAWRSLKLPMPFLVGWDAYAPACVPLLDRNAPEDAAHGLLTAASRAGAYALLLPFVTEKGSVAGAFKAAVDGRSVLVTNCHRRAHLDATVDPEPMFKEMLGSKKLKELRRQRNRLADSGEVTFSVARDPKAVAIALEEFLAIEKSGWKGARGTALAQNPGDAAFIRAAMTQMAHAGCAEIVTLASAGQPLAAGLVLRQGGQAYFFKIAYDESAARMSPGVQLTLDLTRAFCADASVGKVDSIAVADHPMIDHIWRDRLSVADMLIPTRPGALSFQVISAATSARRFARDKARKLLHAVRSK